MLYFRCRFHFTVIKVHKKHFSTPPKHREKDTEETWDSCHLSEWTSWDDCWIMVRIFTKSACQPNEIFCFRLEIGIQWSGIFRRLVPFRTAKEDHLWKKSTIFGRIFRKIILFCLTFNRNFRIVLLNDYECHEYQQPRAAGTAHASMMTFT